MADEHALPWPPSGSQLHDKASASQEDALTLINCCIAGDDAAFTRLYEQYAAVIYRLAFSLLRNQEDAEEVLQDSFEYAFRKLRRYDPRKSAFKSWLFQIAISRCRNKRRRRRPVLVPLTDVTADEGAVGKLDAPDEILERSLQHQAIWDAVGQLSPKLREAAVLRYYEGFSYREIGRILGVPAKTAQSRMRLAQKALRDQLSEIIG